jgi:hypothetical protein
MRSPNDNRPTRAESILEQRQNAQKMALRRMQDEAQALGQELNELLAQTLAEGRDAAAWYSH